MASDVPATPSPVTAAAPCWRVEVARLRSRGPRRRFPLGICVGTPGGVRTEASEPWPARSAYDEGLRFDVVDALVDAWRATQPEPPTCAAAWVTRPGEPQLHDRDLGWRAACLHVFGAHRLDVLAFRVVTRTGWLDVADGERRVWKRLRL